MITGITTALMLKKRGLKVALVEAGKIVKGVTGYTTAFTSSAQSLYYKDLISMYGEEKARQCATSCEASIQTIASLAKEYGIDCDLTRPAQYEYAASPDGVEELKEEYEAVKRLGLPVSYVDRAPLPFDSYGPSALTTSFSSTRESIFFRWRRRSTATAATCSKAPGRWTSSKASHVP